jgi:hypothetical protein
MGVARVAAMVLFASGMVAVGVLLAPTVGLWRHPRACVPVSIAGAAVAVAVIGIQVAAPLTQGIPLTWPYLGTDYFLAMSHFFNPHNAYPSFWSPVWVYRVGILTPLIAGGGVAAVAAGYPAFRTGLRGVAVPIAIGFGAIGVFVAAAVFAAQATWRGILL